MGDGKVKVRRFFGIGFAYVIEENGELTMIDTGMWMKVRNIARKFRSFGVDIENLKRIALTHSHFDHASNAASLKHATGAKIFAHEAEAPYARHEKVIPTPKGWGAPFFKFGEPLMRAPRFDVDVELKDGDMVDGTGLRAIHTPGHTPGHVSYYHESEKFLITGDIMVNNFGMLTGPVAFFSSDIRQARRSLDKLADLELKTIYFSHGLIMRNPPPDLISKLRDSLL